MPPLHKISMIAAINANRALGAENDLLYKIREDMKRFTSITKGHPVIMGRKTWESIPEGRRPLTDRTNIVITRAEGYEALGATVVASLEDAIARAKLSLGSEEIFVIGGGEIYKLALPLTDRLYLTLIDDDAPGEAFFPEYAGEFTKEIFREDHETPEGLKYSWIDLERG